MSFHHRNLGTILKRGPKKKWRRRDYLHYTLGYNEFDEKRKSSEPKLNKQV
jgi:hypothetical protein